MKTTDVAADWLSLPRDLLVNIAKLTLLISVEDLMAFRATCATWNEAAGDKECVKIFKWPRVPFLMFPDKAEFYSLSRKKKYCLTTPLPEPEGKSMKFIESRFGWILTLQASGDANLHYPFSESWIQLPNSQSLPGYDFPQNTNCQFITRSVLSDNPSKTSDYVLAVITYKGTIAFWRPGNQNWTKVESPTTLVFCDIVFFSKNRKFYVIDNSRHIWSWDMDHDSAVQVAVEPPRIFINKYLVESSDSELLMVGWDSFLNDIDLQFEVHRLDFINGVWERVLSLKDAIFVGTNSASFSILPDDDDDDDDRVINSNCIYFTDILYENKGVYNLKDGSIRRFPKHHDSGNCCTNLWNCCSSLWISPSSLSFMASLRLNSTVPDQPYVATFSFFVILLTIIGCNIFRL